MPFDCGYLSLSLTPPLCQKSLPDFFYVFFLAKAPLSVSGSRARRGPTPTPVFRFLIPRLELILYPPLDPFVANLRRDYEWISRQNRFENLKIGEHLYPFDVMGQSDSVATRDEDSSEI